MVEKVIVTVRTLNEEATIERFCQCYVWADEILIADGGSTDRTIDLARKFRNTTILHFPDKIQHSDTIFSNPRGKHINFLINWAKVYDADWIIFDDCDCVPTRELQKEAISGTPFSGAYDMVFAYRMFILGDNQWFPDMNYVGGQSLWAWRTKVPVSADESSNTISMNIPQDRSFSLNLEHPKALLHYFYPNEETLQRKKAQYLFTGEVQADYNPISQFGRIDNLPEWAKWK